MSDDKARFSFTIATPHNFLSKLEAERASLDSELTSSRHAINAAFTAWHLKDKGTWVYFDHELQEVLEFWRGFFATYLPHPE